MHRPGEHAPAGPGTGSENTLQTSDFDASELCSRKLWQLVRGERDSTISEQQLQEAIEELTTRRHYLAELSRMGKLGATIHNA